MKCYVSIWSANYMIDEEDFVRFITVNKGLALTSVRCEKTRLRVINKFFKNRPRDRSEVERFFYDLKQQNYTNASLNNYVFTFKNMKDYLKSRNLPHEFIYELKSFKIQPPMIKILTDEEVEQILANDINYRQFKINGISYLTHVYHAFWSLLAFTGCRYSEARFIKIRDIDFSAKKITILGKGGKYRNIYLSDLMVDMIKELIGYYETIFKKPKAPDDYLFVNGKGRITNPVNSLRDLKKRAKSITTKRVYPHLLRHTYATQEYQSTKDIAMTAVLLGHSDIKTTYQTYVHLADDNIREAAYLHPSLRDQIEGIDMIKYWDQKIRDLNIDKDRRFAFKLETTGNSLTLSIQLESE